MENKNKSNKIDFKKIFNLNNILSQVINYLAYVIAVGSVLVLIYLSFINEFQVELDWKTIGIFSIVVVALVWINWNAFYRRQYEKVMAKDICQLEENKYSIHGRYYAAIKDYTDEELQRCIDNYNAEYERRWLNWVENYTGFPIETTAIKEINADGTETIKTITGIKDLPYKGFKHKILMWRIKTHHYPQSGYKTSVELSSLLSFQDADLSKKNLKSDRQYYRRKSISKFITTLLTIGLGASLVPEMITGEYAAAILKLILALGTLGAAIVSGALSGIQGARLKLSIVEDVCFDLERWAGKKPIILPYKLPIETKIENNDDILKTKKPDQELSPSEVVETIFNLQNLQNK